MTRLTRATIVAALTLLTAGAAAPVAGAAASDLAKTAQVEFAGHQQLSMYLTGPVGGDEYGMLSFSGYVTCGPYGSPKPVSFNAPISHAAAVGGSPYTSTNATISPVAIEADTDAETGITTPCYGGSEIYQVNVTMTAPLSAPTLNGARTYWYNRGSASGTVCWHVVFCTTLYSAPDAAVITAEL